MNAVTKRGRPRGFDADAVLEQALEVFWQHGFFGTSFSDLTLATGLNKPSLYGAFGDKEALYIAALDRYALGPHARLITAFAQSAEFLPGLKALFYGLSDLFAGGRTPCGCMIATSVSEARLPGFPQALQHRLQEISAHVESSVDGRIARAVTEGELPDQIDRRALASYITIFGLGLATAARGGVSLANLQDAAELAVRSISP